MRRRCESRCRGIQGVDQSLNLGVHRRHVVSDGESDRGRERRVGGVCDRGCGHGEGYVWEHIGESVGRGRGHVGRGVGAELDLRVLSLLGHRCGSEAAEAVDAELARSPCALGRELEAVEATTNSDHGGPHSGATVTVYSGDHLGEREVRGGRGRRRGVETKNGKS